MWSVKYRRTIGEWMTIYAYDNVSETQYRTRCNYRWTTFCVKKIHITVSDVRQRADSGFRTPVTHVREDTLVQHSYFLINIFVYIWALRLTECFLAISLYLCMSQITKLCGIYCVKSTSRSSIIWGTRSFLCKIWNIEFIWLLYLKTFVTLFGPQFYFVAYMRPRPTAFSAVPHSKRNRNLISFPCTLKTGHAQIFLWSEEFANSWMCQGSKDTSQR